MKNNKLLWFIISLTLGNGFPLLSFASGPMSPYPFIVDLGWAKPSYSSDLGTAAADLGSAANFQLALEAGFGVYYPVSPEGTGLGLGINGISDNYGIGNGSTFSITSVLFGPSFIQSFGNGFGLGPFVRTDLGFAYAYQKVSNGGISLYSGPTYGFGGMLAVGYGFVLTETIKLLPQVKYSVLRAGNYNYSNFMICIGGMF